MKLAMISVYNNLQKKYPDTRLTMQVHDELVLEVPKKDLDAVVEIVKNSMEQVVELDIPLDVEVKAGKNWGKMEVI